MHVRLAAIDQERKQVARNVFRYGLVGGVDVFLGADSKIVADDDVGVFYRHRQICEVVNIRIWKRIKTPHAFPRRVVRFNSPFQPELNRRMSFVCLRCDGLNCGFVNRPL